jgi:hypothetical protein
MKCSIFWDITPCSPFEVNQRFGGTCHLQLLGQRISQALLPTCFMLVSCLVYSSTLKMDVTCSSETTADIQQTTWHYIPEKRNLQTKVRFVGLPEHYQKP